jgi:amidohydrolase
MTRRFALAVCMAASVAPALAAQGTSSFEAEIKRRAQDVLPQVVAWRRDIHQHPELSNRETRTAALVAEQLKALGLEVRTGVAKTGVVGILRGGKPGPAVALRADMDALPVTEEVDLPFKSTVRTEYNGQQVGVMHACGHDNHVAMLLGVATVLAGMKDKLPGSVTFLFQPAEEGAPQGEVGGAAIMMGQGALDNPKVEAVFGLHVNNSRVGDVGYHSGGAMASSDQLDIVIHGRQTHGAVPWAGIDPIVVSAQVIEALQAIVSRQTNLAQAPAIITIGSLHGGVRRNIIPDSVTLSGTIRMFDGAMQKEIHERIRRTVTNVAAAWGATATVTIAAQTPVLVNDPALTARMLPTLERYARHTMQVVPWTASEDFAFYGRRAPSLFVFLGVTPDSVRVEDAATNHSPKFFADESALPYGVQVMAGLAVDFLTAPRAAKP